MNASSKWRRIAYISPVFKDKATIEGRGKEW
jgi:hypothetical protein